MGIPGLMTYMNQHSDVHLQRYSLHDSYLVIDGNSLASQLYTYDTKSNSCFGGDYDKYAYCISNFFDELLRCNITPLVIIDGGSEDKKMNTIYKRTRDKIHAARNLMPSRQTRSVLFPLLLKETFKNILSQKNIKCAQSLFEADDDLASVARLLNCPVLSFDSDFYVFDVMYVPYNTLDNGIVRNPNGNGFMKNCKVYKIDFFLQRFPHMDRTLMPLAATLLGNDYISRSNFKDFFSTLKLPKTSKRKFNGQQRMIEATFRWLENQTLDNAVAKVLSKLNPSKREKILEVMEMVINGYLVASPRMLLPLGFSPEFVNNLLQKFPNKSYKFQQDVNNLKVIYEPKADNDDETDLSCDEDSGGSDDKLDIVMPENESNLCKIVPLWFIQEFNAANYPSYFIDMLTRQIYVCPVQIEDYSQPTCINVSLKLIRVIFKLLSSGTTNCNTLEYVTRGKLTSIVRDKLQCDDSIFNCKFPALSRLREMPLMIRKEILDNTLEVTDQVMNEFPPEWRLYIATIKHWVNEAQPQFGTNCHLYALLFTMLFHVIDKKIGFHRSQSYVDKKFGQQLNALRQSRQNLHYQPATNMYVYQAYSMVNPDDCLLALRFFLSNFSMDQSLLMNPKKFHISTVHAFSLFQNCLRHSCHLNALLGYPYPHPNIAELLNSTLLYNLYNCFKQRHDIDVYISNVLQTSPSLLQLFVSMLATVRSMFAKAIDNRINVGKRRKNRNKNRGNLQSPDDEDAYDAENDNVSYYDANNRYSMLMNQG
ncbi:protein asteroid [Copidosoma floridanum]|uniref:protein asteroid n=1 Tax=Copidosoma floridanum TaxID=29053 RepID=UPI0006C94B5A|nr:protein asteroid [Copidosoma floridanum]